MNIHPALIAAGGVAVAGGLTAAYLASRDRTPEGPTEPVTVDAFVDDVMDAYDVRTHDLLEYDRYGHEATKHEKDDVLQLGIEDVVDRRGEFDGQKFQGDEDPVRPLRPDLVEVDTDEQYQVGRAFLTIADADKDGKVQRAELTAAIAPHAGVDGKLDADEVRRLLVDQGLGEPIDKKTFPRYRVGAGAYAMDSLGAVTNAGTAVQLLLGTPGDTSPYDLAAYHLPDEFSWDASDGGSDALDLAKLGVGGSGVLTTPLPVLSDIDREHGNGNGKLSRREVGHWVATELQDPNLPFGMIRATDIEGLRDQLPSTRVGRIDSSTLQGRAYYDTKVPQASIDAYFGGDLVRWLETHTPGDRGGVTWQPDPQSGAPVSGYRT